jgi:hypothetical protein
MPLVRLLLVAAVAWLCWPVSADAAELLMFRRAGCPWCAIWDSEVGPVYGKTEVGRRVPIRFVHLDDGEVPSISLKAPIRYTPTFVLVEAGQEVGRIEGYPGEAFFWGLLERLVLTSPPVRSDKRARLPFHVNYGVAG